MNYMCLCPGWVFWATVEHALVVIGRYHIAWIGCTDVVFRSTTATLPRCSCPVTSNCDERSQSCDLYRSRPTPVSVSFNTLARCDLLRICWWSLYCQIETGLPDSEDGIILCSLFLTQYLRVTDGRTDKQTKRNGVDSVQHSFAL